MTRIFLDSNVGLSAMLGHGLCNDLFDHIVDVHCLLCGTPVLEECARIMADKFHVATKQTDDFLSLLRDKAEVFPPTGTLTISIPDADDVPVLQAALAERAEYFVTGDKALLALKTVEGIPLVSPRTMWEILSPAI